ncbi:MAG: hypothetical protein AAGK97_16510 [Bacteroidota bacterium]
MKKLILPALIFMIYFLNTPLNGQEKELYIMGTMHTVPKIVKGAYKPMYKTAFKFKPDVIFMEWIGSKDNEGWDYMKDGWNKGFIQFHDVHEELLTEYSFDRGRHQKLLDTSFDNLSKEDVDILLKDFFYLRYYLNNIYY